jgi:hypothetical protein
VGPPSQTRPGLPAVLGLDGWSPAGLNIVLRTGPGRNWASLWKALIDAFAPVLGEDPPSPVHPHYDRFVSLSLHHAIDTGIVHDVIIHAWWTRL